MMGMPELGPLLLVFFLYLRGGLGPTAMIAISAVASFSGLFSEEVSGC